MSRKSISALKVTKNTNFPDNNIGQITPQKERDTWEDLLDSIPSFVDNVVTDFSASNDTTVPTTEAVTEYISIAINTHSRGNWNTTDALPNTGSGTSGANVEDDFWKVPTGGWEYLGTTFPKGTKIEAMVDGASTIDDFKIY